MRANNNPIKRKTKKIDKIKYYFSDVDLIRSFFDDERFLLELDLIEIELELFSYVNAHNFNDKLRFDGAYNKLFDKAIKIKKDIEKLREGDLDE